MKKDKNEKLTGVLELYETLVCGYSTFRIRISEIKDTFFEEFKILPDGRKVNFALQHIEKLFAEELKHTIKDIVSDKDSIKTDTYTAYIKLARRINNITTCYSQKESLMEELHNEIIQFKNWLREINHHCSSKYMFAYTTEYEYRCNRRNKRKGLIKDVLVRMMNQIPYPYISLTNHFVHST